MFLDDILLSTRRRVDAIKSGFDFPFRRALLSKGMSFICEVKRASPSKGMIAEDFPYLDIASDYERAGAAAVSVLTEPVYFKGDGEYLKQISASVRIPVLRKDFIIDAYQIYEAKIWGASAVLLISEILDDETLRAFIALARSLGLSALVESHSLTQLKRALSCGADIIGVNNRNLETFEVDIMTSLRLREYVPTGIPYVAESGIRTPEDVGGLYKNGVDAVLIGETLMRSHDRAAALARLKNYGGS